MKSLPLLSVIVPVYNSAKFLRKCIDSILGQTYSNLEIILVDDGSVDASPQICDEYAEKYTNIKVVHKANGGASAARNIGLSMAKGDYIGFIDSDDFIKSEMYANLYRVMSVEKADVVLCNYCQVSEDGKTFDSPFMHFYRGITVYSKDHALKAFLVGDLDCSPCTKLYRRSSIGDLRFVEGVTNEDKIFLFYLYLKSDKIVCDNQVYYYYRKNPASVTHGFRREILQKVGTYRFDRYYNALLICEEVEKIAGEMNLRKEATIYLVKTCTDLCVQIRRGGLLDIYKEEYEMFYRVCRTNWRLLFSAGLSVYYRMKVFYVFLGGFPR